MIEWDPRRITDFSFETGLEGVACYVSFRSSSSSSFGRKPFDQVYLNELEKALRIRNMMVRLKEDKILANLVKDRSLETELSWKHGLKMLIL